MQPNIIQRKCTEQNVDKPANANERVGKSEHNTANERLHTQDKSAHKQHAAKAKAIDGESSGSKPYEAQNTVVKRTPCGRMTAQQEL